MTATNHEAFAAWNGDSARRWVADPDRQDRFTARVGDALLEHADLRTGQDVLDIGCGCGATTLAAARTVGAGATVHGVDISEPMLGIAGHRASTTILDTITFTHADAQTHPFEPGRYDVAISRFGTMFFDDPVAAFATIAGALRPGGRLCLATWQPLGANQWLTVAGSTLLPYVREIPSIPATGPGMFAQSDPATVRQVLDSAGYQQVELTSRTVPLHLGVDVGDAVEHLASIGVGRALLGAIPDEDRPTALAALSDALQAFAGPDGVHLEGAIWIITAQIDSPIQRPRSA